MNTDVQTNCYVAILHYPVYDKNREIVRTSITPIDLHDVARASRTYGVRAFYLVTPLKSQRVLARLIIDHWYTGWGATYNPTRKEAFGLVRIAETLAEVMDGITREWGGPPLTVVTGAQIRDPDLTHDELAYRISRGKESFLILFGTGWGMVEETMRNADYRLEPIHGRGEYNHLSVRSAVSIVLDRIMGRRHCNEPLMKNV